MLVSEAIEMVRQRINDEFDTGYRDETLLGYINDAIKYLASALIIRKDPVLTNCMDVDGTSEDNPVPQNFACFAGNFPVMRKGNNFHVADGSPMVTVKYFYYPDNLTDITEELPFKTMQQLEPVIINLACIYALNQHEFNIQQDEAMRLQLDQLINQALGEVT